MYILRNLPTNKIAFSEQICIKNKCTYRHTLRKVKKSLGHDNLILAK